MVHALAEHRSCAVHMCVACVCIARALLASESLPIVATAHPRTRDQELLSGHEHLEVSCVCCMAIISAC